ncbi:MAG: hypothetical protein AABW82_02070 [Nanoarchaeota archaeon]|nr:hypothetical protein [Nanoarchaeota archaeon]
MAKKKGICIQCKREVIGDIRCKSCRAKSKHASPNQQRLRRRRQ